MTSPRGTLTGRVARGGNRVNARVSRQSKTVVRMSPGIGALGFKLVYVLLKWSLDSP